MTDTTVRPVSETPVPDSLAGFAACAETDLTVVAPWAGPAIDEETGLLREALTEPHLIATSVGWPKPGHEPAAIAFNEGILKELYVRDGLLAVCLAWSERCWNSTRSLSIWRDEAALRGFLKSAPHIAAARHVRELMFDWEGTHWQSSHTADLPTFEQARARLDEVRPAQSPFRSY